MQAFEPCLHLQSTRIWSFSPEFQRSHLYTSLWKSASASASKWVRHTQTLLNRHCCSSVRGIPVSCCLGYKAVSLHCRYRKENINYLQVNSLNWTMHYIFLKCNHYWWYSYRKVFLNNFFLHSIFMFALWKTAILQKSQLNTLYNCWTTYQITKKKKKILDGKTLPIDV